MKRSLLLSGLVYGLFILGMSVLKGEITALAIPLVIYLAAALLFGPDELQLEATRTLSADRIYHRIYRGTPVDIKVSITNKGSRLEQVLVQDQVPPHLNVDKGAAEILTSLSPGETIEFTYTVHGSRGDSDWKNIRVRASDRLGLLQRELVLALPAHISILPQVSRLRRVAIRPRRTRGYAGPVPARQGGSGIDFFGVREYQPGDPLRWVNWRVSARHPHGFFSNEFEQERIADVGLILDARQQNNPQVNGNSLFEHSVHAAASLADLFLSDGNRVGLLVYGQVLDWTFSGYGKVQRERIMQALARAKLGKSMVFDTLDYLPTRLFPAQSQLVIISPLCRDDLPMLIRLRARGYQLLIISPDLISFEVRHLPSRPAVELAARIARVERTLLFRKLRQVGVQIVDWQVDKPFDQVIHADLGRAQQWFRRVGVAS